MTEFKQCVDGLFVAPNFCDIWLFLSIMGILLESSLSIFTVVVFGCNRVFAILAACCCMQLGVLVASQTYEVLEIRPATAFAIMATYIGSFLYSVVALKSKQLLSGRVLRDLRRILGEEGS